jgi:hypothetical protein
MTAPLCELWILAALFVGAVVGLAAGATTVHAVVRARDRLRPPFIPAGPLNLATLDQLRLDVEVWYDLSTAALDKMRGRAERP